MSVGRPLTVTSRVTRRACRRQADADRRALEGHGHVRLDELGELDLLKVDMRHDVLDLVELVFLDDRHMRLLVAFDHDVEHGVQAGAGAHRGAQGMLVDGDAHGRLARAVQDGRNEPRRRRRRASRLPATSRGCTTSLTRSMGVVSC